MCEQSSVLVWAGIANSVCIVLLALRNVFAPCNCAGREKASNEAERSE